MLVKSYTTQLGVTVSKIALKESCMHINIFEMNQVLHLT